MKARLHDESLARSNSEDASKGPFARSITKICRYARQSLLLLMPAVIVAAGLGRMPSLGATDVVNEHGQRELKMGDLPEPPDNLKDCLDHGNVTFLIGGTRPSLVDPSRSAPAERGGYDAETRYSLSYSFKSRCRWGWADTSRSQRLAIRVRYEQLELTVEHQVWLRELPDRDTFWDSPLVRHELDHVRLSSDPRLAVRFVAAVKRRDRIELTGDQSASLLDTAKRRFDRGRGKYRSLLSCLTGDDAQRWLDGELQAEFERIVQLVEIRYRELDRQTDHGRRVVPADGDLHGWLVPSE